jgi:hypothetical protein
MQKSVWAVVVAATVGVGSVRAEDSNLLLPPEPKASQEGRGEPAGNGSSEEAFLRTYRAGNYEMFLLQTKDLRRGPSYQVAVLRGEAYLHLANPAAAAKEFRNAGRLSRDRAVEPSTGTYVAELRCDKGVFSQVVEDAASLEKLADEVLADNKVFREAPAVGK